MIKHLLLFCSLSCMITYANAQSFSENFSGGVPLGWLQTPASTWTAHSTFGVASSPCIYTEDQSTTGTVTNVIQTGSISMSGSVSLNFMAALTKNNFICPNIVAYFNTGSGKQFIARWGSGFSSNTTYTVNDAFDPTPPLDAANVNWFNCIHNFTPVATTMTLIIEAEMVNGGYVLLDDINLNGKPINPVGIVLQNKHPQIQIYPNPVCDKLTIESDEGVEVSLTDLSGRTLSLQLHQITTKHYNTDVSHLSNGFYLIKVVSSNGEVRTKKLLKE